MDFLHIPKQERASDIKSGDILIAEPLLADGSFSRTVVLICEHGENGTIGFIINRDVKLNLTDLLPDEESSLQIYEGGPVQNDTLHMLHRMPLILGGLEISPGIYWGGSFDVLKSTMIESSFNANDVKLYLGYAGWSVGQLEKELSEGSWYVGDIYEKLLFDTAISDIWRSAILDLGKSYAPLINLPSNPQLN